MDRYDEAPKQAISLFGTKQAGEEWMTRPAFGLERRKPIDLICKSGEAKVVETYLSRMDYGVYC